MTKSRIALSKINRSVSVRSSSRPFDFHRTAARFEPEKNTPGNTRSRSNADEQTNRVPRCVKRKSSKRTIFFVASNICVRDRKSSRLAVVRAANRRSPGPARADRGALIQTATALRAPAASPHPLSGGRALARLRISLPHRAGRARRSRAANCGHCFRRRRSVEEMPEPSSATCASQSVALSFSGLNSIAKVLPSTVLAVSRPLFLSFRRDGSLSDQLRVSLPFTTKAGV